jgi:hypothetical protein
VGHVPSFILGYVRYMHSPVSLGLTSLELFVIEYCRRPSTSEGIFEFSELHLEGVFRILSWLHRGCEVLMPRVVVKSSFIWGAIELALYME